MVAATSFDYDNLSGRPVGPVVRALGLVLPGVRRVGEQVVPYAAAWAEANRRALEEGPDGGPMWVAIGDSMTQGIGASAWDRGWVGQLAPRLATRHRIVNLSFNGARVADVLDRQLPALERLPEVPDLVTVMIGSNDLVSRRWREALPASAAEMLRRLPAGTVVATQPGDARPSVRIFNRLVDEAARERGLVVADFRDPRMRSWRGKVAEDHFHPNDRGYAGMAELMGEAVAARG